jgi:hypothetical protein
VLNVFRSRSKMLTLGALLLLVGIGYAVSPPGDVIARFGATTLVVSNNAYHLAEALGVIVAFAVLVSSWNAYWRYGICLFLFGCSQVFWLVVWRDHPVVVEPGDRDVAQLGGPCAYAQQWAYQKLGPTGYGACGISYTNAAKTAAIVELQVLEPTLWARVTVDMVADGDPPTAFKWRVTHGQETPWQAYGNR